MFFFSTRNPVTGPMMGGDTHQSMSSPLFTFHDEPCNGQTMMSPTTSAPSLNGVPMCGHKLDTPKSLPPSVLPRSTSLPPKVTALNSPGANSPAETPDFNQVSDGKMTCVVYRRAVLLERRNAMAPATAATAAQPTRAPLPRVSDSTGPAPAPRSACERVMPADGATKSVELKPQQMANPQTARTAFRRDMSLLQSDLTLHFCT
mmetsp:Transcript_61454/g.114081  ORF Transcript_61454/g.114081 Transcript_61454/m.114081 type:complete len:204 (-) Transcript_61454:30-641(-)